MRAYPFVMTWGKWWGWWGVVGVTSVVSCSKSDGEEAPSEVSCGDAICSTRETCDTSAKEPRCECREAFDGADCESCAVGYEEKDGSCEAVAVDCDDSPCGLRGACVSQTGKADYCECNEHHGGPTCAQCEEGYQDNDQDDACVIGCDNPELTLKCEGFFVCDDLSGIAECACPAGSAGENCELCDEGYARRGDEPCYKTCDHPGFECGEGEYCYDDQKREAATCLCPFGTTGDGCTECADDFEKMGDLCTLSDPPQVDLLTFVGYLNQKLLAGIHSTTGEVTLLRGASAGEGLVYDPTSQTLFVADYRGVGTLDESSGKFEELASLQIGHGKPLVYDTQRKRLVTFRSNDYQMLAVDPDTGAVEELGTTGVSWLWDATYDAKTDMIYGLRSQGGTPSVHAMNPGDGMSTELGSLSGFNPVSSESSGGVAVVDGLLMVLARDEQTLEQVQVQSCRDSAQRLGLDDYEDAPYTLVDDASTGNVVLESELDGKELIIHAVASSLEVNAVELAVTNPEAFLCIFTYGSNFTLKVGSDAKWAGGIAYSYESIVDIEVANAGSVSAPIVVFGGRDADLSSVSGADDVVRALSAEEVSDRILPPLSDFSGQMRRTGPYVLRSFELPSLTQTSSVSVDAKVGGALTAFK